MKKLDLHNIRHHDVKNKLIRFLEDNRENQDDVEIITGNSSEMKGIVANILDDYCFRYKVGGELGINTGMIRAYY